ncbi:restriction endonuclease subunit S [Cuspidothrix issatschenkoi]|uniref:Restriction endonuclease subunit S n=1 Tax=Cuspidothrix issatschenkoi CHARLIE-1 TaxID=2052836 RepID=A0A2S6CR86_9CYAN|nr:restriction endonuclease subunit S [Cuspidothrix issatschenkoi]PPJ62231.1 restriction endonuclease subunit S [Cuspidothrix issatschenkoi CHARLIE-1]
MSNEWPRKTIAECAADEPYSTQIGPFGKALTPEEYTPSGVPLLRGINVNHGRFYDDGFVFISEETADRLSKFESFPGDVLLVHKGTLGQIGIMPKNRKYHRYIMGNSMLRVKCNTTKLIPEYLYYWLCSDEGQHYLFSRVSQVGVPQIQKPLTTLREASLPVPPLSEQKAIAHILSSFDDKIELNRQMNETLEAMARAIFKSWFVDFDPVSAKRSGRQPAGMDTATADLFPDDFEESSLGLIPKGWKVGTLGEEIEIIKGKSYKSSELVPSSTALVTLKSFHRGGGYRPDGLKPYNGTYKPEQIIKPGELVVAYTDVTQAADVIGKPAIVKADERYNTLVASLDLGIIRVRNKNLNIAFLYYLFNQNDFQNHVYSHTNGSTVLHLSKDGIPSYEFCLPHSSLISKFEKIISPIFDFSNINWQESINITTLRDTLLPKLMSGQIRVKEAEKIMEKLT